MKKRLIVHIGANKTGSSSIQDFLWTNRKVLRQEGLLLPGEKFELLSRNRGTTTEFENLIKSPNGSRILADAIIKLAETAPEGHTILLTAENLAAHPAAPALFSDLTQHFEMKIKLYVRRQDEYLLSSWQQWYSKVGSDFWAWTTSSVGTLGDWRRYIENWEKVVSPSNISVRVFERAKLDSGDVVVDFYNRLHLDIPLADLEYQQRKLNPGLSDAVIDLVKGNKTIFKSAHDNGFHEFVQKMTGDAYMKSSRQSPITFEQRTAILSRYAESNRWLQRNYFNDGALFAAIERSDYEPSASTNIESEKLEFIVSLLYQMYIRNNK